MVEDPIDYETAVSEFNEKRSTWEQVWNALKEELWPNRKNWFGAVFSTVLALLITYIIVKSEETVAISNSVCGILLDVQLSIFGCLFAVYSILLVFFGDDYLKKLLQIDYHKKSSYLKASTRYYEAALLIYFVAIGISLVFKLILECLPAQYILTNNNSLNEFLAGIILGIYFLFSIRAIYELKSIIGNTLLLFRTSIQLRIISFWKNDEENRNA